MSKVVLAPDASGTGTFTLASPDSNTDRTLTLPDNSGTLMSTGSAITTAQLPVGSVLQVVQGSTATQLDSVTTAYVDTTLTATITPTSATSKILVMVTQSYYKALSTSAGMNIKLFRDATDLGVFIDNAGYTATTSTSRGVVAFQTLDTPSTTSPVTYKTQFANTVAANLVRVQPDMPSQITLMEIAA